jgi:hypothetical protein
MVVILTVCSLGVVVKAATPLVLLMAETVETVN